MDMIEAHDMGDSLQIDVTRQTVLRRATGVLLSGGLAATGTTGTAPYHVINTNIGCPSDTRADSDERDDMAHKSDTATANKDDGSDSKLETDADALPYYVCHKLPGNPSNAQTMKVGSKQALEAHPAPQI